MIFRYSLLSLFRTKGKTALFSLLLFTLTLALSLGVSVWASVAQFLNDADDYYTTIGLIEYMGINHPNETIYDAAMDSALKAYNIASIGDDEDALLWNETARSLGYIDGFWRTDDDVPSRMQSVLVVGNITYSEKQHVYSAIVMDTLYSLKSEIDTLLLINEDFGTFEPGHFYLVFGEVYYGSSPLLRLRRSTFDNPQATELGRTIPHMVDITTSGIDGQFYDIPEDSILLEIADTLRVTNNSLLVTATNDLMSQLPFHQQELYLVDGRAFTEDEYSSGDQVVIISELVAKRLGVSVGDTIDLSIGSPDQPNVYHSYWVTRGFSYSASFKVVGITNTVNDKSWYAFVPRSAGVPPSQFPIGYTIGQVVVQNDQAAEFLLRVTKDLPDRFQLTMYDQGYATVAIPYQTILRVAKIVTVVTAFVELAVLVFFGFLFVYRQREASETMQMLGTGKIRVAAYFLSSAGLLSLLSTTLGSLTGFLLHDHIITLVNLAANHYTLIDSRFSNGNLTISRVLEFSPQLKISLFLAVGAIVFMLTLVTILLFSISTFFHHQPNQLRQWEPKKERTTSHLPGGSIKYALLSIIRGGPRSLVVPLLSISVVLFFGQLTATTQRYQEQLSAIYEGSTIRGYYTDINGKQTGNQVINAFDVANLSQTKDLSSLSISIARPYIFLGINKLADGTEFKIEPLFVPDNYFAYESLQAVIQRGSDLTATNNIRTSPEFFYANDIEMNFLPGYDESMLTVPYQEDGQRIFTCILPIAYMKEQGIHLGDTVRVAIDLVQRDPNYEKRIFQHFDLLVIGSYKNQGTKDTIYAPLALFFDTRLIWGEGQAAQSDFESKTIREPISIEEKNILQTYTFQSTNFSLKDAQALTEFKDYLTVYGYSQVQKVGSVREFIVLNDASFNAATASIKQQILYINTLYPFLYALAGIIAFVVSYLLIVSRKKELATMRGLGGTRPHTFFSFFLEQALLVIFGTVIGLGIWQCINSAVTDSHLLFTAGFLGIYFLGCTLSIGMMNHANVLTILLDKD